MLEDLGIMEYLKLNAELQKKKNALRKQLKEKGVLKKDKINDFDHYAYFSEAGYKELFTELFSANSLELTCSETNYEPFTTTSDKQPNGRWVKLKFILTDCETGFWEETEITGEGVDKGDKAGYKAYTGALKYYLANTFMVATGDDAEKESPEYTGAKKIKTVSNNTDKKASPKQVDILSKFYTGENLEKLLQVNGVEKLEDISLTKASELITKLYEGKKE